MKIVNHKIEGASYLASPNHGAALTDPTLLVMHYTASGRGAAADQKFFGTSAAKASAHIIVGDDGTVYQSVPFNVKAWHAGVSTWRGRANCNDYSIGIEVDNWGILQKRADGKVYSWTGVVIPDNEVLHAKNKRGVDGYWQVYPEAQLRALDAIVEAILEAYPSIKEVVGHEDIAPVRKTDPGPAFPLQRYANMVGGRTDQTMVSRTVIASSLNARGGPGTNFAVVASLPKGTKVDVVYDAGDWSQIRISNGELAWVYDQYLA